MKRIYSLLFITIVLSTIFLPFSSIYAQGIAEGVAIDITLAETNVPAGSIITLSQGEYRMARVAYDPSVVGVITDNPSVHFEDVADSNKRPLIAYGRAQVRVSSANGEITKGDVLTTSETPGVGQKATENGSIIGLAMESFAGPGEGKIYATLHLNTDILNGNTRQNLLMAFRKAAKAPFVSPVSTLRYIIAAFVALLSFFIGFWFFGRVSSHGVEAIGRNPLARQAILISVVFNVFITLGVMLLGVALAYLILIL